MFEWYSHLGIWPCHLHLDNIILPVYVVGSTGVLSVVCNRPNLITLLIILSISHGSYFYFEFEY